MSAIILRGPMAAIYVENLQKVFRIRDSAHGFQGVLKQLFTAKTREFHAVQDLSFEIQQGERVAFVGPNGAGKSTTIKMLTGILYPTAGSIKVLGLVPWKQRKQLAYRIGTIFGQRSQLWYHLPAYDTFNLIARIYDLDPNKYQLDRKLLINAFDIGPLIEKPVRQLSLGERMRCEIVASLIHNPEILFLDEPTIGLDVTGKAIIRDLIKQRSEISGTTLLLTSHDTGDMEEVCDRILLIHQGKILLDQSIQSLRKQYICRKIVTLQTSEASIVIDLPGVKVLSAKAHKTVLEIDLRSISIETVVQKALKESHLSDLTVEDPPLEEIIKEIYKSAEPRVGEK
jgi:ABC-2 type transport system ATP-binding protein